MTDRLPPPAPIPPPDRQQLERINSLYDLSAPGPRNGWRGAVADRLRGFLVRLLFRQQEFNAAVVEHLNRNAFVELQAHQANVEAHDSTRRTVESALDEVRWRHEAVTALTTAVTAWQERMTANVQSIAASHDELRTSLSVLQQAAQNFKHEVNRLATAGGAPAPAGAHQAPQPVMDTLDSHKYVGFEDRFRGAPEEIRRRVSEYLPLFAGARDVLDLGCGRGEFLRLLREEGISARGIDVNAAMVQVCRGHGLDVIEADALGYLRAQPDRSLGGLFAAQVVEHLEPRYLMALLDAAFDKLRPGAPIVLETINPACWFAFFESYIRDITHVRAIHPETLQYLLVASGFQRVEIKYSAPYPDREKLQPLPPTAVLGDSVETLNANVERLNRLLFTFLDYAAIGRRS
jgi:O-antigen chain-terminating methyltransferase